jgi:membrane protease YdiL (CAAX protease family)
MEDTEKKEDIKIVYIVLVFLSWIAIEELYGKLLSLFNYKVINIWIWAAVRMTVLFLVTYLFIKWYEDKSFSKGFNFNFSKLGKNVLWAVIFFVIAGLIIWPYLQFVVNPLVGESAHASTSMEINQNSVKPFMDRLIEYLYIVYEGVIEVFIFIGFLLDRMVKKIGWIWGIVLSNIGFALWHYDYLQQGILPGILMIFLTFILGVFTSLNYYKTRNTMSGAIFHTLVDSPNAIRILLGIM